MLSFVEYHSWRAVTAASAALSAAFLASPSPLYPQVPSVTAPLLAAHSVESTTPASVPRITAEEQGDSLAVHQRYQAAIQAYAKAPQTAAVWNKMGIAYQMMFNLKDATRCYRESLKLESNNPNVLNNLGTVYDSLKQYGPAEKLYKKALKRDPQSALILKNLGTNLLAQRKYGRGWEVYKQALAIDPQIFQEHGGPQVQNPSSTQERGAMNYYMAMGCVRAGLTDCALQYLRMALNEGFTNPKKVASDIAFASLRDNPDFQQLLAAQSDTKAPQAR
jgi:Tfp pilus assembly protein PilF